MAVRMRSARASESAKEIMQRAGRWAIACVLLATAGPLMAIPPLVSGDVPTAPDGTYELFVGYVFRESEQITVSAVPFWELVYGLTKRQELTIEWPLIRLEGPDRSTLGLSDVVLGTKVRFLGKPEKDTGWSASLEVKLPTGDTSRGLSSGKTDVNLRTRFGWEIGSEVIYFNLGYTWIGEPEGVQVDNVWFYSGVWDHPVRKNLRLLVEIYGATSDDPDGPSLLAATIGTKWRVFPKQQFQFSIGRSLRSDAGGGPRLRLYLGWRWDF